MNACLFQRRPVSGEFRVNSSFVSSLLMVEQYARLFVVEVPDEVSVEEVRDTLRDAGPRLLKSPIDWQTHEVLFEDQWPDQIRACWQSGQFQTESWKVLDEPKRITIRIPLRLFALVETEAHLRTKSLNQFCVDSLAAQVRTRSKRLELLVLQDAERTSDPNGIGRRLGDLFNMFSSRIPDCDYEEIVDTLKRLAHNRYLALTKWRDSQGGFAGYVPGQCRDDEFFYQGDFRYRLSEHGRPYIDGLRNGLPQAAPGKGSEAHG